MVAGTKRAAAGGTRVGGRGWGQECAFWSKAKLGRDGEQGKLSPSRHFFLRKVES